MKGWFGGGRQKEPSPSPSIAANATTKVRVRMDAVKIHGPNSHLPEGTREDVQVESPTQIKEVTFEQAVELFGEESARQIFKGTEE